MILLLRAVLYYLTHPRQSVHFTVVRRYADAQKHFIGELYEGEGRTAKMIGATCDNWPLNATSHPLPGKPKLCWGFDFLAPLPENTLRVGALEPQDNASVQSYVSTRRFNALHITVLNRFVEHIMESDYV